MTGKFSSTSEEKVLTTSGRREKTESVTFRIESKALKNLRREAKQKDISTNTLVNKLVKDHINWHSNVDELVLYLLEDHLFQRS